MGYIESHLLPDEQIIFRARLHWLVFGKALLAAAVAVVLLWVEPIAAAVTAVIAVILVLPALIARKTSEFGVTTKRVIVKVGLVRRRTIELLLRQVEAISVEQSITGRVFNYGSITLTGTGGVREVFDNIGRPLEFRRAIQSLTT
jgi:uncharacterized membrane protein YdbT with pleckstrin-like domain